MNQDKVLKGSWASLKDSNFDNELKKMQLDFGVPPAYVRDVFKRLGTVCKANRKNVCY